MKLYDELIHCWLDRIAGYEKKTYLELLTPSWKDSGSHEMVLTADMAYQLGSGNNPGYGATVITTNSDFVEKDEVIVIGKDLNEISEDLPYARITIVRVAEESLGEGNDLYKFIKKIEFVRYHVNPEGYMQRISFTRSKEAVRVSKLAVKEGISFEKIGKLFIEQFHKNEKIEAVKVIFITLPEFPYDMFEEEVKRSEEITKTIDHILKNMPMDCHSCGLQKICDEVEGMKQLHFGLQNQTIKKA